jgi:hypothetical protein
MALQLKNEEMRGEHRSHIRIHAADYQCTTYNYKVCYCLHLKLTVGILNEVSE